MARDDRGSTLRAALADGFAGVLGEPHVQSALALWDRRYAAGKPYALIEYVNELAAALTLPTRQRHELRMALYRALLARGIDPTLNAPARAPAGPVPAQGAKTATATATATPGGNAAFRVFRCVAQALFHGVRADGLGGARMFENALRRQTDAHGLTPAGRQALLRWAAEEDDDGYFQRMSSSEYPAVAHLLYVAACEALGPVAADRLLSRAVKQAEALPEAASFAPQRLL